MSTDPNRTSQSVYTGQDNAGRHILADSTLVHFPVNLFASVMGFAGLTLAWMAAGQIGVAGADAIGAVLRVFTTVLFLGLVLAYTFKTAWYFPAVRAEFEHPVKLNFFATIPIGAILLAQLWLPAYDGIARFLWATGTIGMLVSTLATVNSWLHQERFQPGHVNPAWFIPVVGNMLIPVAGVPLGYVELSWFFFSTGFVFWMIMMTIVIARLIFHKPLASRLQPTLFILLAPPAVGFLALHALETNGLTTLTRVLFYTGLFIGLLLASNLTRFMRLPFFVSGWAYAFPVAALTLAAIRMFTLTQYAGLAILSVGLLAALSFLVAVLTVKTIKAGLGGDLFGPEPAPEPAQQR
ncbi:SLAC1 anion channel family protein [Orrella marina]|uniref:C4-dicarboxylate ABC transporter n=1 Tax=Orrella marina TaxID=2163011 RepID=A0A2R4XFA6_9BURK|nr:SLAC1 anion channel family protein [Orrella marina]AWB32485.1 C4-dicarboxylate ABC transporter [Orrella marina]